MTTYLTTRKGAKLELNGNQLSGDTFAIKDYIKANLDGKWNGASKSWTINPDKLSNVLSIANSIGLHISEQPATTTSKQGSWVVNAKYGRELGEDY